MKPINHVILSGGVSAVFGLWMQSFWGIVVCFLSGIFIDLDHHLDYFLERKELPLSYKKLVDFLENDHRSKLYLVLHSYELIALLWVSIFYFQLNAVWLGAAIGFTAHIFCDEIVNPLRPLSYFLTYRVKHNFRREMFFKKGHPHAGG